MGRKIRTYDDATYQNSLISLLAYLYALLGLKTDKLPSNEESFVISDFIRSKFSAYSFDDFKTAFKMAAAGELDVDANTYQNFSCEYIGKIMKSYDTHRNMAVIKYKQLESEIEKNREMASLPDNTKQLNHEFLRECIIKPWNYYLKKDVITFGIHPYFILYKVFTDELNLINLSAEEKREIWSEAKKQVEVSLSKKTSNPVEFNKIRHLKDQIQLIGFDKAMEYDVKQAAYEISVKRTLIKMKNDNFDLEKYILDYIESDK